MNKVETIKLDNGLTIYLYEDKRRHSTFFDFVTLFGGMDKDFILNKNEYHMHDGIAHILEHYICECSDAGNFLDELGKRQMNTNASTSCDMTSYYFDAVEDITYGINTILKGIYNVKFTSDKLDKLKNPIIQEIRGKMDNKFYHSNIMTINNLFNNMDFRTIGGTVEEVQNTTIEEVKACYNAFYQPSNQMIFIAGNFDKKEVLDTINDFYNNLELRDNSFEKIKITEEISIKKDRDTLYFNTPMNYDEISFKIDCSNKSPEEILDLSFYLSTFFNQYFGNVSPLYKDLVDNKTISSHINVFHNFYDDILVISIGSYNNDTDYFINHVLDKINKLDSFNEEVFELDKNSCTVRLILRDDSLMGTIMPFIENVVSIKYPYLDEVSDMDRLSYNDFIKVISEFDFSNYTITSIKNKEN